MIDVAPSILEAAGIPEPLSVNGVQQSPMEGTSMIYSLNDAVAPERHDLQYFEMFGNRGIYHKGWSAVTKHRTPWEMVGAELAALTTTSGSSTTAAMTGLRPMISSAEIARETRPPATFVADRGRQVQRAADR